MKNFFWKIEGPFEKTAVSHISRWVLYVFRIFYDKTSSFIHILFEENAFQTNVIGISTNVFRE